MDAMLSYNSPDMEFAVETRGLARTFGALRAVDGIDLRVPAGSFYGFLGPNGAGKSTTIKCLTGPAATVRRRHAHPGNRSAGRSGERQAPDWRRAGGSGAVRAPDGRGNPVVHRPGARDAGQRPSRDGRRICCR